MLRPDEVRRFLQRVVSPEMRGSRRVPLTAIAAMAGIDRKDLYEIIITDVDCAALRCMNAPASSMAGFWIGALSSSSSSPGSHSRAGFVKI